MHYIYVLFAACCIPHPQHVNVFVYAHSARTLIRRNGTFDKMYWSQNHEQMAKL